MVDPAFRNQGVAAEEAGLHNRAAGLARFDQGVVRAGRRVEMVARLITNSRGDNPGFDREIAYE